jgi:hypothetical protein
VSSKGRSSGSKCDGDTNRRVYLDITAASALLLDLLPSVHADKRFRRRKGHRRRLARSSKRRNGPGRRSVGTTPAPFASEKHKPRRFNDGSSVRGLTGLTALGLQTQRQHTRADVVVDVFNLGVGVAVVAESRSNSRDGAENAAHIIIGKCLDYCSLPVRWRALTRGCFDEDCTTKNEQVGRVCRRGRSIGSNCAGGTNRRTYLDIAAASARLFDRLSRERKGGARP